MRNKSALLLILAYFIAAAFLGSYQLQGEDVNQRTLIPSSDTYQVVERSVMRDRLSIYGQLYIPVRRTQKMPMVIISHGFGGNIGSVEDYAPILARSGIVSYVFDFCGGGPSIRSDGSTTDMSVLTEVEDLSAILNMAKSLTYVDERRIFLMGESQGGLVSALVAAKEPIAIKGLILLYPAFRIEGDFNDSMSRGDPWPRSQFGIRIGKRYADDARRLDTYATIAKYTGNVLILHGDRDSLVPLSYSNQAIDAYKAATLVVMPGAGHGFYGQDLTIAGQKAVTFITSLAK